MSAVDTIKLGSQARQEVANALEDAVARLAEHANGDAARDAVLQAAARFAQTRPENTDGYEVVVRSYDSITPKRARWAWDSKLPMGALSLMIGTEGLGKTALGIELVAQLTQGKLPGALYGTPVNVALFTPEDDPAATIWPRLEAAGADRKRVLDVKMAKDTTDRGFSLPDDTDRIVAALVEHDVRFAFADPLASLLDPKLNSWKDTDVRAALEPLVGACAEHGITLLGSLHTNKSSSNDPRQRGMGSAGWQQIARAALLVGLDPDDEAGKTGASRCVAHTKHNLGPWTRTRKFKLESGTVAVEGEPQSTVHAVLGEECDTLAADMLAAEAGVDPEAKKGKVGAAFGVLHRELASGPVAVTLLKRAAEESDVGWRTMERAAKELNVAKKQTDGGWTWAMPEPGVAAFHEVQGLLG